MGLVIGFLYDIIGIRAIRKEKNFIKKLGMTLGFPKVGLLLIVILLSI